VDELKREVPLWEVRGGKLTREFKRRNFQEALDLVNAIGRTAEKEGHHPDLTLYSWNRVRVELYTHSIGGLSENDFIVAAKTDWLLKQAD